MEKILEAENLAETMSTMKIIPQPPEQKKFILRLLINKIPLLSGFLQSLGGSGTATTALIKSLGNTSQALQGASTGFHYAGLGIAAVNFVRIPLIYFFSLIAGEPPPFTLSNNARWAYSALLLGLTLTAILVPAAAPPIALAMASLSLVLSLVSIGNMIYNRYKIKKSLQETNEKIKPQEDILELKRENARLLGLKLKNLKKSDEDYEKNAMAICKEIEDLNIEYEIERVKLQKLYNDKLNHEQTLKGLGTGAFVDRGVTAALTSVAIIGLSLSLFFPPVGLGIVAGSAGLGVLYVVGRVAVSLLAPVVSSQLKKLGLWNSKTNENEESLEPSLNPDDSLTEENPMDKETSTFAEGPKSTMNNEDSTLKTMRELFGINASKRLQELKEGAIEMDILDSRLSAIIETQNHREALKFFQHLTIIAQMEECPYGDLRCVLDKFSNMDKVLPLLEDALEEVKNGMLIISKEEKVALYNSEPLRIILKRSERLSDLSFLISSTQHTESRDEKQKQLNFQQQ
ncbi:coiled-coil protein [Legionella parisiensis]|uniref:Coiled-coil protein n=2 Tax=Legionella parisiensis TaxID=45071 RepID=A0A1E5JPI7_9GAMM|nr:coiled-coil protein [Legionella parisiensis]OEH46421.1 hypothetical protein lpari_02760 [Legionella parisiensis]STX75438.1 coiled-coil protein [Legionella parisiensis]